MHFNDWTLAYTKTENFSNTISREQAQTLKNLVHKKAKGRKQILQTWNSFKRHFSIKQYKELPAHQYKQALAWLKN